MIIPLWVLTARFQGDQGKAASHLEWFIVSECFLDNLFDLMHTRLQVLGYGWAGLLRKYVVEPAHMWWPSTLVQVSLFRFDISLSLSLYFLSKGSLCTLDGSAAVTAR